MEVELIGLFLGKCSGDFTIELESIRFSMKMANMFSSRFAPMRYKRYQNPKISKTVMFLDLRYFSTSLDLMVS